MIATGFAPFFFSLYVHVCLCLCVGATIASVCVHVCACVFVTVLDLILGDFGFGVLWWWDSGSLGC